MQSFMVTIVEEGNFLVVKIKGETEKYRENCSKHKQWEKERENTKGDMIWLDGLCSWVKPLTITYLILALYVVQWTLVGYIYKL